MKIKIQRTWNRPLLDEYPVLKEYKFEHVESNHYGIIQIDTLEELFDLQQKLGPELIISSKFEIEIYDDYRE